MATETQLTHDTYSRHIHFGWAPTLVAPQQCRIHYSPSTLTKTRHPSRAPGPPGKFAWRQSASVAASAGSCNCWLQTLALHRVHWVRPVVYRLGRVRLGRLREAGGVRLLIRPFLGLPPTFGLVDWHLPPELALIVLAPGGSVRCGCKRLLQPGPKQWRLEPSGSSAMLLQKVTPPGPESVSPEPGS